MELTLTALIKATMLHWGRSSIPVINKSKLAPAPPLSFGVTIDCTLVVYSNLTGSNFFYIGTIFIFQAECVLVYIYNSDRGIII